MRRLKILETGLFIAGAALLLAFFAAKSWSQYSSQAAVAEFEAARAVAQALQQAPGQQAETPGVVSVSLEPATPDFSLWSEKRVAEYQQSLLQADDPPLALLSIEHLDIRVPVFNGATDLNLNRGVARILGTARIGETGNLGIAGHRDGFFRGLKDIQVGDRFYLETLQGRTEFTVASVTIVGPEEVSVLAPTDTPSITLVTCYPFYHVGNAPKRFIVKAEATIHQISF